MELENDRIAKILGLDPGVIKRMVKGGYLLNEKGQEWLQACYIIRLYKGLIYLCGDKPTLRHWLKTDNNHLNGEPRDLILDEEGLQNALTYVEGLAYGK